MKKYNDKEVNRLLAAADDLLADIQLYETPEEEQRRKEREEELRRQEETRQAEELLRQTEKLKKQAEELPRQEETRQAEELSGQEETRQMKEFRKREDYQPVKELQEQEKKNQPEEIQPEEAAQSSEPEEEPAIDQAETVPLQEESEPQIDIHQLEALGEEEALRRLEEIRRQEAIRQQEEARQLKRMRWRELNGQGETSELPEGTDSIEPVQSEEDEQSKTEQIRVEPIEVETPTVSGQQDFDESVEMRLQKEEEHLAASERIKQPDRPWLNMLFIVISMIYLELLTHFGIYQGITTTVVYPILFAAGVGCVITIAASFLPGRWNALIVCTILILGSLYCDLQLLYHAVEGTFLRLAGLPAEISLMFRSGEALLHGLMEMLPFLLFMFLPVLLWAFVGRDWIHFERSTWLKRLFSLVLGCILVVVSILCLDLHGYEANSPYVCMYRFDSDTLLEPTGEQLGMTALTTLEILEFMK